MFAPSAVQHSVEQFSFLLVRHVEVLPSQLILRVVLQASFAFQNKFVEGAQILAEGDVDGLVVRQLAGRQRTLRIG